MKQVNGSKYIEKDGIFLLAEETKSSRERSWITIAQIDNEFPEFVDKISEILYYPEYSKSMKDFARNILVWLDNWKFVSWKQFDSIFRIVRTKNEYYSSKRKNTRIFCYGDIVSVTNNNTSYTYRGSANGTWTDKYYDDMSIKIFGTRPMYSEEIEHGMTAKYRGDGSRFFEFPSGDESLSDYVTFGFNFKGLVI